GDADVSGESLPPVRESTDERGAEEGSDIFLPRCLVGGGVPRLLKSDFAGQLLPLLAGRRAFREKRHDGRLPTQAPLRRQRSIRYRTGGKLFVIMIAVAVDGLADQAEVVRASGQVALVLDQQ